MPFRALHTGATGMMAQSTAIDVIANNVANVNTLGFKTARANFEDLFYQILQQPGLTDSLGNTVPTGIEVGLGTRLSSTQRDFSQGNPRITNRQLDVMIEGAGFFRVQVPDDLGDGTGYTRAGNFNVNSDGLVVTDDGYVLQPQLTIPANTVAIQISPDGTVGVQIAGDPAIQNVGNIELSHFLNAEGLQSVGSNLFIETDASGPDLGPFTPGQSGTGFLRQGVLEESNVNIVSELVELIKAQRAFEFNAQSIEAADESLQLIANLRR